MAKQKKGAKKKFFDVVLPLTSTKIQILGYEPEELQGKVIKLDLTRNLRGKSLELRAEIKNEKQGLVGEPLSLCLAQSYIRRMIRKGTDYVEDSFESPAKDILVRIKPFMITRRSVSRAVRKELRNEAKKYLEAYIRIRTVKEIFSEIMSNKIQKELSLKLKKIYPLALCEIRALEIVRPKETQKAAQ